MISSITIPARCGAIVLATLFVRLAVADEPASAPPATADSPADASSPQAALQRLAASIEQPREALELVGQLPRELTAADRARLRMADAAIGNRRGDGFAELSREMLLALARQADDQSLAYLHEVFESLAERRGDAAEAIANYAMAERRRAADWRLLVRALPLLESGQATTVLTALRKFPERGTKPQWQREVILAGLRTDETGQVAAAELLSYWTGLKSPPAAKSPSPGSIADWQAWFRDRHADLPPAELPRDAEQAKYRWAELLPLVYGDAVSAAEASVGEAVFEKAQCVKCHRFGARGEAMGPDLTSTRLRYARREMLQAILFPSHSIAEQYETMVLVTDSGKVFSGVVEARGNTVTVLQANGEKATLDRKSIDDIQTSARSAMPDGLLEPLTEDEIAALFAYLYQRRE
ncbi:MAG: c-type cytochrome [Planctomycetales bacterium]|nr:c-type cytochrome [Planctomycetales bacterium]